MTMKNRFILLFLLTSMFSFAQVLQSQQSTTRAVVIGISDYQDDKIPDLKYADKDAEAFAQYLKSSAGGALPADHIMLLTNQQATTGAIASAMDWVIADSKEGDKAIIYFSGHGDVETRTKFQRGFLLTHDSPPSNYLAGAFALIFLQDIISTLSDEGIQVIMISDACRAGKLAGSEIGGAQATAANLSKQFANEIKILSCQPNEFSLEGKQWGGGRGAFSFHLIDALTGMADGNEDFKVNLLEVNRYLEEVVPMETDPHMQIPMTVGSKGTVLAYVDDASLSDLKMRKEKEQPSLAVIETKGFEEVLLAVTDSIWQSKYEQFTAALEEGNLLEPPGSSAYDLYIELSEAPELKRLKGIMKRNLAAKLQDESQQAINAFLRSDNEEIAAITRGEAKYSKFVRYLEKATELLGSKHYMYKTLKAKQYYFEGLDIYCGPMLQVFSIADSFDIWHARAKTAFQKSLDYEPNAAYTHLIKSRIEKGDKKMEHYRNVLTLTPQWATAYISLGYYYIAEVDQPDIAKADSLTRIAIELDPKLSYSYQNLALIYHYQNKLEKAEDMFKKAIALSPGNIDHLDILGWLYYHQKKYAAAEKTWLEIIEWSPDEIRSYNNLSEMYYQKTLEYDKAIAINKKRLEKRPTDGDAYSDLASAYFLIRKPEKIEALIEEMKVINDSITNWEGQVAIGQAYLNLGEPQKALPYLKGAVRAAPTSKWNHYMLANAYRQIKDYESFLNSLDTALINGFSYYWMEDNSNVPAAHKSPGYKAFAQRVIDNKPEMGYGYNLMGKYYEGQGDLEKAFQFYKQSVSRSPETARNWIAYGKCAYLNSEKEEADTAFQKYIEVSDQQLWRYNSIGSFCRMHSEYIWAEKYLRTALEKDSSYSSANWNLAWVLFSTDRKQEAYDLVDKYIGLQSSESNKASFNYLKGLLKYYSGHPEESLLWFSKAADLSEKYRPMVKAVKKVTEDDVQGASSYFEEAMKLNPGADNIKYIYCQLKTTKGDYDTALDLLEKALDIGGRTYDFMSNDPKLEPLRTMPRYKEMMQQYFPEKMKK